MPMRFWNWTWSEADGENFLLLDGKGREVPWQIARDGKKLLLRSDLDAHEKLNWRLMTGKPREAGQALVTVTEHADKGWYEIGNGLTGVRIPDGKDFRG